MAEPLSVWTTRDAKALDFAASNAANSSFHGFKGSKTGNRGLMAEVATTFARRGEPYRPACRRTGRIRVTNKASTSDGVDNLRIALIVGCARSGTSILGELVAAHPDVTYLFETHHLWESSGSGVNDSHRLGAAHATVCFQDRIRRWFRDQLGSGCVIAEKTPRNVLRVPFLRAVLPEARIIHIVRDGRDVACSLVPGIGGAEWLHLKPPSWRRLLATTTGVVRCALAWKEILEIALEDLATVPHLQVRYEDLVIRPEDQAARIAEYLELPPHPAVKDFCTKIQDATDGSYHARHQSMWYRDDHRQRIGRWRENMTLEEQRLVEDSLHGLLRRLGYA